MMGLPVTEFHVKWSEEDEEWVATTPTYPSLSWLATTPAFALLRLTQLIQREELDEKLRK